MNWLISSVGVLLFTMAFPVSCLAANEASFAYGAGRIFGFVFLAVLAFLGIKKLMRKS
jgi:hypothetical protein